MCKQYEFKEAYQLSFKFGTELPGCQSEKGDMLSLIFFNNTEREEFSCSRKPKPLSVL